MEKIKNLLNQVSIISKKNAEILDATGGRFNMFRVCGVNHYENTHSAILAELLNPNGTHGLKSKLLECFIETKGEDKKNDSNVKQKQLATIEWCKKINSLNPEFRDNREWEYILLAENDFYTWKNNSASLIDICKYAKVVETAIQGTLF